jgi:hypothetical protein
MLVGVRARAAAIDAAHVWQVEWVVFAIKDYGRIAVIGGIPVTGIPVEFR